MLRELQMEFRRAVCGDASEGLLRLVCADGLAPAARMAIYRNNVTGRLTDALKRTYPVVCALVDQQFFAYAADVFIRSHLPRQACLAEYGADFPDFLQGFAPAAGLAYLPDVARLEWTVDRIQSAPRLAPVPIAALAAAPGDPAELRLRITPSTRFLASAHRIDAIWGAHQAKRDFQPLQLGSTGVHLQISATATLYLVELPPADWAFRAGLADGSTLGAALAMATNLRAAFDPAAALASLFQEDLVVGVAPDPRSNGLMSLPPIGDCLEYNNQRG